MNFLNIYGSPSPSREALADLSNIISTYVPRSNSPPRILQDLSSTFERSFGAVDPELFRAQIARNNEVMTIVKL